MTNKPILSIITTNRNDQYRENELGRLKFILNYFIFSLNLMNVHNKIEYIIVDWGSEIPFSNYFKTEILACPSIKFINVPQQETSKFNLNFDTTKALNLGIDNSLGEHIMLTSSDQFFPVSVFNNLMNILENPLSHGITGDEYKIVPRKYLRNDFLIFQKDMELVNIYLNNLKHSDLPIDDITIHDGTGAGGNLLKKEHLLKINGIKDSDFHNHGHDNVLFQEISNYYPHIDTANFGVFLFKLPISKIGIRRQKKKQKGKIANPLDYLVFTRNDKKIDINKLELINKSNPPEKKLDFEIKETFQNNNSFELLEYLKATFECSMFTIFNNLCLKSLDVKQIIHIKKIIKINKIKLIILDKKQSLRFMTYLGKNFQDAHFVVILNSNKHTQLDILKFRNLFASRLRKHNHYGYLQIANVEQIDFLSLNKYRECCIIRDLNSDVNDSLSFMAKIKNNIFDFQRSMENSSNNIIYKSSFPKDFEQQLSKISKSNIFIDLIIFTIKVFMKVKRIIGNLKRSIVK